MILYYCRTVVIYTNLSYTVKNEKYPFHLRRTSTQKKNSKKNTVTSERQVRSWTHTHPTHERHLLHTEHLFGRNENSKNRDSEDRGGTVLK